MLRNASRGSVRSLFVAILAASYQEATTVRLEAEEAERRVYVPRVERVLVPIEKRLLPGLAAGLVERLAASKAGDGQVFDITEMEIRCRVCNWTGRIH